MLVEYRMTEPFEVALAHGLRDTLDEPDGSGVFVGNWTPLREEKAELISSERALFRDEHYVRLIFQRGPSLTVDANGRHLEMAAWSAPDARGVVWRPPAKGTEYGTNTGDFILYFDAPSEHEEYLILYAGTDFSDWDE